MADHVMKEIRKYVTDKVNSGAIVRVDWLTAEIIASKDRFEGDDSDFYLICAHKHVAEIVKDCIGKYKPKPQVDAQLVLDGFEHLQKAYPVERDGVRLLVPVHLLSDEELEARAIEYVEMARGCVAHAKEIRAFIKARRQSGKRGAA